MFISQREQDLELACAWCAPGGSNDLMGLLAKVCVELPQEGVIWIAAVTPVSAAIVDKLLPDRKIVSRYYRAVWDMER